uniref:Uncharacterized protein n=1 Tax=Setaria italica TaxID=4555 RepID=K3ZN96_SETIT
MAQSFPAWPGISTNSSPTPPGLLHGLSPAVGKERRHLVTHRPEIHHGFQLLQWPPNNPTGNEARTAGPRRCAESIEHANSWSDQTAITTAVPRRFLRRRSRHRQHRLLKRMASWQNGLHASAVVELRRSNNTKSCGSGGASCKGEN